MAAIKVKGVNRSWPGDEEISQDTTVLCYNDEEISHPDWIKGSLDDERRQGAVDAALNAVTQHMTWLGRKRHRSFALDSGGLVHYSHAGTYTALNNDVADIPDAWYEHVWDLVNEALGL